MRNNPCHSTDSKEKVLFLVGPTAVGKSQVALYLAKRLNAEIISCDSMQVYKKMDILSAKIPSLKRQGIRHHLINIVPPTRSFSVSDYRRRAVRAIKDITRRKKIPLFVGGCGFYMNAVLDGIFKEKKGNRKTRERLYEEAQRIGKGALYQRLKTVDPQAALRIHPHDLRRIVRALEVYENSGVPISELQKQRKGITQDYDVKIIGLIMDKDALRQRISGRVDNMFKKGLVDEVRRLSKLRLSRTAAVAIGIREIKGFLNGEYDLKEVKHLIKRNSKLYSKRQMTWFRKDARIDWIQVAENNSLKDISERIYKRLLWKECY